MFASPIWSSSFSREMHHQHNIEGGSIFAREVQFACESNIVLGKRPTAGPSAPDSSWYRKARNSHSCSVCRCNFSYLRFWAPSPLLSSSTCCNNVMFAFEWEFYAGTGKRLYLLQRHNRYGQYLDASSRDTILSRSLVTPIPKEPLLHHS